jgi:hypothetical protein
MNSAASRLGVFVNREKIIPAFFTELYFKTIIDTEFKTKFIVHLPAKHIVFYRRYYTHEKAILKKFLCYTFVVNF